jgi:hypothetical protein
MLRSIPPWNEPAPEVPTRTVKVSLVGQYNDRYPKPFLVELPPWTTPHELAVSIRRWAERHQRYRLAIVALRDPATNRMLARSAWSDSPIPHNRRTPRNAT